MFGIRMPHREPASRGLGRVADFCAICRQPTAQSLSMHGQALHWYGLRVSFIDLEGYTRRCTACAMVYAAEEGHYRDKVRWRRPPLPELITRTQPNLAQKYAWRLDLEARLLVDPELLTREERQAMVNEPFDLYAGPMAHTVRNKPWDLWTVLAILAAIFLPLPAAAFLVETVLHSEDAALFFGIAGGLLAAALATAIVLNLGASDRHLRRRIFPKIARALRPLEPTADEVVVAMARLHVKEPRLGTGKHVAWMLAATRR